MNRQANFQNHTSESSKRESLGSNFSESASSQKDSAFDRQQYIAECKRLLSGFRKCQYEEPQHPEYEQKKEESSKLFKHESENNCYGETEGENSVGIEVLEKMLDEFDELYNTAKSNLANKLCNENDYSERKVTLDDYFGKIEARASKIKNSQVFRAFKNLYLSSQNIFEQRQAQDSIYQSNIDKIKAKQHELKCKKEREEEKDKQLHYSKQNPQSLTQSTLFKDIQNSSDLSPEKRQRENQTQQTQSNDLIKPKKHQLHNTDKSNQENSSPIKVHSSLENAENQENFQLHKKQGKENSSQRRRKSERQKEQKQQSQNPQTQSQQLQQHQADSVKERMALKDNQNKSLFKNHKLYQKSIAEQEIVDVTKAITVDSQVINFGKFICGKILGSTLQLTNTTNQEQILEVLVDSKSQQYHCDEIFGPYQRNELPFDYKDGSTITNSEIDLQSWFIENPITKDLVKSLIIRIGPSLEKELIIVMKSPSNKMTFKMASFITIKLANLRRSNSISRTDEEIEIEKRLTKRGNDISDIDIETIINDRQAPQKEIRVMLIGRLENPKIECLRELHHDETQSKIIPLGVKKSITQQKFRIPFKNLSSTQDADLEFTFVKMPKGQKDEDEKEEIDMGQYFEFYCQPSAMKITQGQQQFLNVLIKVNSARLSAEVNDTQLLKRPINKLLIGRLKDTNILFSYFVSINLINQ